MSNCQNCQDKDDTEDVSWLEALIDAMPVITLLLVLMLVVERMNSLAQKVKELEKKDTLARVNAALTLAFMPTKEKGNE